MWVVWRAVAAIVKIGAGYNLICTQHSAQSIAAGKKEVFCMRRSYFLVITVAALEFGSSSCSDAELAVSSFD